MKYSNRKRYFNSVTESNVQQCLLPYWRESNVCGRSNLILETSFHTATTKWEDSSKTAHPNKHSSSNNGETFFNQSPLTKGRNEVSLNKRNCCMLNHEGTLIFQERMKCNLVIFCVLKINVLNIWPLNRGQF